MRNVYRNPRPSLAFDYESSPLCDAWREWARLVSNRYGVPEGASSLRACYHHGAVLSCQVRKAVIQTGLAYRFAGTRVTL